MHLRINYHIGQYFTSTHDKIPSPYPAPSQQQLAGVSHHPAQYHNWEAVGCVSCQLSCPRLQELLKQPGPPPGESLQHPDEIQGIGDWKSGPQLCWAHKLCACLQAPCPTTLTFWVLHILSPSLDFSTSNHGNEAHFPHQDYLTQDRLNAKLRPQEAFSVLWHP